MQITVDANCNLVIEMSDKEKGELIDGFCKTIHQFGKMTVWFENSQVNTENKEPYFEQYKNMINSVDELMEIMRAAKVDPKAILDNISLPF